MLSGIIGSILGFGSSVVPAITEHYKSKRQMEFELKKMQKMAELKAQGYDHEIKRFQEMGLHEEQKALLAHDTAISQGTGFMSALQKSVRPVITYAFFILFAAIEITLLREAINNGMSLTQALNILWDDDTKAIFAAIISFWFGSRAIEKARSQG
ncbi:hypothetical protein YFHUAIHA_CDS0147 [Phage C48C1]|nr:hypothetical protein YFHUAIHA_CDS0147 [Phage C48C1]